MKQIDKTWQSLHKLESSVEELLKTLQDLNVEYVLVRPEDNIRKKIGTLLRKPELTLIKGGKNEAQNDN